MSLSQNLAVKFVGAYVTAGFVVMEILYLGVWCRPFSQYYSFNEPFGSNWTFWYIRESSTAIITANLPYIWTLLRRIFKLGSFSGSTYGKSTNNPSKAYRSNFT